MNNLMTQKEVAQYLGTTVSSMNTMRYHGQLNLPFLRWGNRIRYRREDVEKWVADNIKTNNKQEVNYGQ